MLISKKKKEKIAKGFSSEHDSRASEEEEEERGKKKKYEDFHFKNFITNCRSTRTSFCFFSPLVLSKKGKKVLINPGVCHWSLEDVQKTQSKY